jgi:hypothetical protein
MPEHRRASRFAFSCGLVLLPILAWNLAFAGALPPTFDAAVFWHDIPAPLAIAENVLRIAVFALPFLMPLDLSGPRQRWRLGLAVAGMLVYFAAWLPLMLAPQSRWSLGLIGFTAPAYTPLLWIAGIALVGRRLYWRSAYRPWMYLLLGVLFVGCHCAHVVLVHGRLGMPVF